MPAAFVARCHASGLRETASVYLPLPLPCRASGDTAWARASHTLRRLACAACPESAHPLPRSTPFGADISFGAGKVPPARHQSCPTRHHQYTPFAAIKLTLAHPGTMHLRHARSSRRCLCFLAPILLRCPHARMLSSPWPCCAFSLTSATTAWQLALGTPWQRAPHCLVAIPEQSSLLVLMRSLPSCCLGPNT